MKIGLISQWFPPEHGSAALPGVIAQALADAGHDVSVVTGFPNYPDGDLQSGWRQRWRYSEQRSGALVHRTPLYVSHDHRSWRRMLNYASFAVSATVTSLRELRSVDVAWVHATPALPALAAMALRRVAGVPYVLHIQDLWPDTVVASGMLPKTLEPLARGPLEWFCRRSYARAAAVAIIAPGMRDVLIQRGVQDNKIVDIPNWADESIFKPTELAPGERARLGLPPGFVAMYAGAMGDVQGLETIIRAAELVQDDESIHLALVGDGVARPRLEATVKERGLTNVTFVEPQPLSSMSRVMSSADVQIICLKDLPLYRITLPSKVQATLAAGRPILVSAGGDASSVVSRAHAGISVEPGDEFEMAKALRRMANASESERSAWGERGRQYYADNFSQGVGVSRMVHAMEQACCGSQVTT